MQTIITKFLSPTNKRNSRIKARQSASYAGTPKSVTIDFDYRLNIEQNHRAAAMAFAAKMGWEGEWVGGSHCGEGYVFVNASAAHHERMTFNQENIGEA